jgi:hypothetical protein
VGVVPCIHLESNTLFVVILFYSDIQIFSTFAFHNSKSLFVSVGDSVGHLVASILNDILFLIFTILSSNHFSKILRVIKASLDGGVARD